MRRLSVLVAVAVMCAAQTAAAWEIELTAKDESGAAGPRFITCGVPLLPGQAKETSEIALAIKDANGRLNAVPAQFRVLARWWRKDNSIRCVLADAATTIDAGEAKSFYLADAKSVVFPPNKRVGINVRQTDDSIEVYTGVAVFVINRKKFSFIDSAIIDLNGDGKLTDDETVLVRGDMAGTVVHDTFGQAYLGSDGTESVEVIESGPMRVCVRARGRHIAPPGKGYSPGMYGYDVFLNFYADSTDVYCDVVITNNPPKSIGSPTFEDASLVLDLADRVESVTLYGDKDKSHEFKKLADKESVCLYQDSNGADTWAACPGFGHMDSSGWSYPKGTVTSFRGYRVFQRQGVMGAPPTNPDSSGKIAGEGNHARGLAHIRTARGGLIVHTKKFWQQFPKAVEVAEMGRVRIGLFPGECKVVHFIEDTSAKGHEIVLHFYGPGTKSGYAKDEAGRPDAACFAACWDGRLMFRTPVEHAGECGALADMPFSPPIVTPDDVRPDTRIVPEGPRMLTTDQLYGNAYGWQVFGERWRSNGGHGKRGARQPIDEDSYLWRWYVTGSPMWFEAGDNRSRHFRDVRTGRIDGQDPFGFKDWQEFRRANRSEDWTNRPQPKGEEYEKYSAGRWARSEWPFPNPEHCVLDLLYDRYLLFGDVRCLEHMRVAAAHGGYLAGRGGPALTGSWQWRALGWSWRTLYRYWELTGDKAAEACLEDIMKTHAQYVGKGPMASAGRNPGDVNWWFTGIYCRAVAMTAVTTGDARMLELCKTLAEGKEANARRVATLFAALYHLTGDEKYKKAVLGDGNGDFLRTVRGYYPSCDHWLLNQPPRKP